MNRLRLAAACLLAVVLISLAEPAWGQLTNVQISLTREYGRGLFRECRLDVTVLEGKGRSGLRCFRTGSPDNPGSVSRDRALTASEISDILKLSGASDLFAGGHVGADATAVDGLFETLRVTEPGRRTVVLVSSGNDTFTIGSRRELIRLLYSLLNELQKAATQE
jgi:hypothetical protein